MRLWVTRLGAYLVAVGAVLVLVGLLLTGTGRNPWEVYHALFVQSFATGFGISQTVQEAVPICLIGLGVAAAARIGLWNVGGEGQFYMGAFAAAGTVMLLRGSPAWVLIPTMAIAAGAAGALWGLIPALPRAYLGVSEILTTLMLNHIAIQWNNYLLYGPWRDPGSKNFPLGPPFPNAAHLPTLGVPELHAGLLLAVAAFLVVGWVMHETRWGYEVRVAGANPRNAQYAGIATTRHMVVMMVLAGTLAGLAGMAEVAGVIHRLQPNISPGYGYTAITVAWLSGRNLWYVPLTAFIMAGLVVGGYNMQMVGVPAAITYMVQGALLAAVLGANHFVRRQTTYLLKERIGHAA